MTKRSSKLNSTSKAKTNRAAVKRRPPIRLACVSCDRDDYDGVWRIPKDWTDIQKWQTLGESLKEVSPNDTTRSVFDWHTHTGYRPERQQADS